MPFLFHSVSTVAASRQSTIYEPFPLLNFEPPPPRRRRFLSPFLLFPWPSFSDIDTDQAGLSGSFDCAEILNLTVSRRSNGHSLLGEGAVCTWTSASVLKVTLGGGTSPATVVPGDLLHLRDGVLSAGRWPSMLAFNQSTLIVGPDNPTEPAITINAPSAIGICDDLKLDASATSGSGGRSMNFNYTVTCSDGSRDVCANVTRVLAESNEVGGGSGSHTVTIPSAVMPLGISMNFRLQVSTLPFSSLSRTLLHIECRYQQCIRFFLLSR